MSVPLSCDPHPLLDAQAFVAVFPASLESIPTPGSVLAGFAEDYEAPFSTDDDVKRIVRDLFRHAGFKPTGRSKPASEYLIKAQAGGFLSSINVVVDACNVASLWSGLPISVVDLDVAVAPYRVGVAEPGTKYVFNASGQEIDVGKLICLHDAQGPCANAVKDCQRTKTSGSTTRTLCVVWGTTALGERASLVARWYREMLESAGASTELVSLSR